MRFFWPLLAAAALPAARATCTNIQVTIYVGSWASEMSWSFSTSPSMGAAYSSSTSSYTTYTYDECVEPGNAVFTAYDSYGDGWNSNGYWAVTDLDTGDSIQGVTYVSGYGDSWDLTIEGSGCGYVPDALTCLEYSDGECGAWCRGSDGAGYCSDDSSCSSGYSAITDAEAVNPNVTSLTVAGSDSSWDATTATTVSWTTEDLFSTVDLVYELQSLPSGVQVASGWVSNEDPQEAVLDLPLAAGVEYELVLSFLGPDGSNGTSTALLEGPAASTHDDVDLLVTVTWSGSPTYTDASSIALYAWPERGDSPLWLITMDEVQAAGSGAVYTVPAPPGYYVAEMEREGPMFYVSVGFRIESNPVDSNLLLSFYGSNTGTTESATMVVGDYCSDYSTGSSDCESDECGWCSGYYTCTAGFSPPCSDPTFETDDNAPSPSGYYDDDDTASTVGLIVGLSVGLPFAITGAVLYFVFKARNGATAFVRQVDPPAPAPAPAAPAATTVINTGTLPTGTTGTIPKVAVARPVQQISNPVAFMPAVVKKAQPDAAPVATTVTPVAPPAYSNNPGGAFPGLDAGADVEMAPTAMGIPTAAPVPVPVAAPVAGEALPVGVSIAETVMARFDAGAGASAAPAPAAVPGEAPVPPSNFDAMHEFKRFTTMSFTRYGTRNALEDLMRIASAGDEKAAKVCNADCVAALLVAAQNKKAKLGADWDDELDALLGALVQALGG